MAYVTNYSFKKFIKLAYDGKVFRGTPVGDFIEDAFEDRNFKNFKSAEELIDYVVHQRGSCGEAAQAAAQTYMIWKDTHGMVKHGKARKSSPV